MSACLPNRCYHWERKWFCLYLSEQFCWVVWPYFRNMLIIVFVKLGCLQEWYHVSYCDKNFHWLFLGDCISGSSRILCNGYFKLYTFIPQWLWSKFWVMVMPEMCDWNSYFLCKFLSIWIIIVDGCYAVWVGHMWLICVCIWETVVYSGGIELDRTQ